MKYGKQFWVEQLGREWALQLKDILKSPYAEKLMDFVFTEYATKEVKPAKEDLFLPFRLCSWSSLKIVILCDEPHQRTQSSGLGFGDKFTSQFHSATLTTVFDCIEREYYLSEKTFYFDFDFTLEEWAKQGVLLLNRSLSVRIGSPGSHKRPWGKFNSAVLNTINEYNPGTIFMLWGKESQQLIPHLKKNHYLLTYDSPGEYSDKNLEWHCPNFREADELLKQLYGQTIKW